MTISHGVDHASHVYCVSVYTVWMYVCVCVCVCVFAVCELWVCVSVYVLRPFAPCGPYIQEIKAYYNDTIYGLVSKAS